MFVLELLLDFLGDLLLSFFHPERGGLEKSPWERRQAQAGHWMAGAVLFVAVLIGVWVWAAHRL